MTTKTIGIILIAVVAGVLVLGTGVWIGRALWATTQAYAAPWGMMGGWSGGGPGMMGGGHRGGPGMMGGYRGWTGASAEPLTIGEARTAVESYLQRFGDADLEVGEVMIFDNHAYAEVVQKDTGEGAFEVLVDPVTRAVYLEYGPAMMWNTDYGMMGGYGGRGMMGGWVPQQGTAVEPTVTAEQARQIAQDYLERYQPGLTADEEVDAFPGYYTLHTRKDGEVFGMLSVNAYTGQVWVHSWHGQFIEMSE